MSWCGSTRPVCEKPFFVSDEFCCRKGFRCLFTAENTTLICCPYDEPCVTMPTISCDVTELSQGDIITTAQDKALPECGESTCCPFGYHCGNLGLCELDDAFNQYPPGENPYTTQSSSNSFSYGLKTHTPIQSSAIATITPQPESSQSAETPSPALTSGEIAAIAISGVLGLILALLLSYLIRRFYRSMKARRSDKQGQEATPLSDPNSHSTNEPKTADQQPVEAGSNVIYELAG
ncbi:hypothetical protein F4818DRAFT_454020 [Hypoxylon cercidicola]|nr:hypothetical protein F4818DRAFT_454020 [Hypoxylon cercidicola]